MYEPQLPTQRPLHPPHVLPPSTSSSAARFECYARCALVFLASTNCFYYF